MNLNLKTSGQDFRLGLPVRTSGQDSYRTYVLIRVLAVLRAVAQAEVLAVVLRLCGFRLGLPVRALIESGLWSGLWPQTSVPNCGNITVVKHFNFCQTAIKDVSQQSESEKVSVNNQTVIEFVIII